MLLSVIILNVVILPVVVRGEMKQTRNGSSCSTPNGESARCLSVHQCQIMVENMIAKRNETFDFMKKSRCGLEEPPLVCCGTYGNYLNMTTTPAPEVRTPKVEARLLPEKKECGIQARVALNNRVWGGIDAQLGEFPWMARIIHMKGGYGCAGTLISDMFVMTAAHCVMGEIVIKLDNVDIVRLGEHDVTTTIDCENLQGVKKCAPPPVDVRIASVVYHTRYNSMSINAENDIAILLLKNKIYFNDYIRPICVQTKKKISSSGYYIAGWGSDKTSHSTAVKQKLYMPHFEYRECLAKFKSVSVFLGKSQICAGGNEGEDACTGDSGGPLMSVEGNHWFQDGIVSFGRNCGENGWPGVYTQVSKYYRWIKRAMKKAKKVSKSIDSDLVITKV